MAFPSVPSTPAVVESIAEATEWVDGVDALLQALMAAPWVVVRSRNDDLGTWPARGDVPEGGLVYWLTYDDQAQPPTIDATYAQIGDVFVPAVPVGEAP